MPSLSVQEFDELIGAATWLWRWEAQPEYHEPEEAEPFARWQAGEPDDLQWLSGWLDHLRHATGEGRRYQRVRRLADPLPDYQAWSLTVAPANIDAGEEIRLLDEHHAADLGLPGYDFVLVNDQTVARMEFGASGFTGADLLTGHDALVQHRTWRDLAWHHAITFSTYTRSRSP